METKAIHIYFSFSSSLLYLNKWVFNLKFTTQCFDSVSYHVTRTRAIILSYFTSVRLRKYQPIYQSFHPQRHTVPVYATFWWYGANSFSFLLIYAINLKAPSISRLVHGSSRNTNHPENTKHTLTSTINWMGSKTIYHFQSTYLQNLSFIVLWLPLQKSGSFNGSGK